jgi:hypothetical protein
MFDTLYLHIGWSKTGTSAIQFQLDLQCDTLKNKGILYSKSLQMNDQAHHHFALAFAPIHGYPAKYTVAQALALLDEEMNAEQCHSALVSSELSPFYFNNPRFAEWVNKFKQVIVIGTVRRQTDLLLSLFNQLVKDPQVRYHGRFFQMALNNFPRLNYFQQLNRWAEKVGKDNIKVINYDDGVVESFLALFELTLENVDDNVVVNPSLPTSALLLVQEKTLNIADVPQYTKIRNDIIEDVNSFSVDKLPKRVLLTAGEMYALDKHFEAANNHCAKNFLNKEQLFKGKVHKDVLCF